MGLIDKPFNFFIIFKIHWEFILHIWSFFRSLSGYLILASQFKNWYFYYVCFLLLLFQLFIVPHCIILYFVDCQLICFNFLIFLFLFVFLSFQFSLDAATCSEAPVCIEVNIHIKIKRLTCFVSPPC